VSVFWFVTGMLTTVAVLVVILPWLRTIPGLGSLPALPWQAPVIALLMIGATLAFYRWWGRPDLVAQTAPSTAPAPMSSSMNSTSAAANSAAGSMGSAVASLRARLEKGGGSADDWELLAKSYEFMGQPDAAAQARAHQLPPPGAESAPMVTAPPVAAAPKLTPQTLELLAKAAKERADKHYSAAQKIYKQLSAAKQMNADAWADYADTVGTIQGGKLAGDPETFVANALALDPAHPKALWLKASADEEAGRHQEAVASWQRLLAVLPKDSEDAKLVQQNLEHEQQIAAAQSGTVTAAAPGGSSINGEVSIDTALAAKAAAGATLFIVAKSVDMPGPPVAVYRGRVGAWPVKFTLDDSQSMLPGRNLSNAKHVTVEARVSASGQAQPAPGDLRGMTGVVDPASHQPLKIVINEVVS
jgi:cytochrome c-type biogenesis protein CcmH/NrfG